MINGNGRPLSKRKQVQFMVALTLLAWATETLRHQWARGSEANFVAPHGDVQRIKPPQPGFDGDADDAVATPTAAQPTFPTEKFVTITGASALPGTMELRSDATIAGDEVQLKQICRWTETDQATFAPVADFVVEHLKAGTAATSISMEDVRRTMQEAGVNVAVIDFVGASACKVTRSDAAPREIAPPTAVLASSTIPITNGIWHGAADQGIAVSSPMASSPTTAPSLAATSTLATSSDNQQFQTLRQKLIADCAFRTHVPVDQLQVEFRQQDALLLVLSEPHFHFDIQPIRVRNLGDVVWSVTILTDSRSQKVSIEAEARAWQNQLVIAHPIASHQVIRDEDCTERRTMVDTLSEDPLLTRSQLVGQQASRELSPGTVMSARMVQATPMVRAGELITITLTQGSVQIKSVARAMENGAFGESIRVRNDATRDVYEVTMTGPQTADLDPAAAPK